MCYSLFDCLFLSGENSLNSLNLKHHIPYFHCLGLVFLVWLAAWRTLVNVWNLVRRTGTSVSIQNLHFYRLSSLCLLLEGLFSSISKFYFILLFLFFNLIFLNLFATPHRTTVTVVRLALVSECQWKCIKKKNPTFYIIKIAR